MFPWESLLAGLDRSVVQEKPSGQSSSSVGKAEEWEGGRKGWATHGLALKTLYVANQNHQHCNELWQSLNYHCVLVFHKSFICLTIWKLCKLERGEMKFRFTKHPVTEHYKPYLCTTSLTTINITVAESKLKLGSYLK